MTFKLSAGVYTPMINFATGETYGKLPSPVIISDGDGSSLFDEGIDFNFNIIGDYYTALDGSDSNNSSLDFNLKE